LLKQFVFKLHNINYIIPTIIHTEYDSYWFLSLFIVTLHVGGISLTSAEMAVTVTLYDNLLVTPIGNAIVEYDSRLLNSSVFHTVLPCGLSCTV